MVDALDRATTALRSAERRRLLLASNAVEEALLWCDTQNPLHGAFDRRLMAALEYLGSHLSEPMTVNSLARVAGMSSSRLAHLATAQLGVSLMRYVEERRLDLARQLLDLTDLSVGQIARQVGFSDPLYFSHRFRRATELSPSGYRAIRRNPQDDNGL